MRILVTGGYGFIGSAFVQLAFGNGHDLTVLDKMTYAADFENIPPEIASLIDFEKIDIADNVALIRFLKTQLEFDYIVNFAAESHVDRSIADGLPFVQSNIIGVVNLLEFLKKNRRTKFLQVSTDEVYGSIINGSWDEDFPLNPRSAYSSSKASAEFFCNAYKTTHNLEIIITRCANNFGPRQSAEKFIPTIIRSLLNNHKVPIYGSGENRREWIYVADHARSLLKIIEHPKPSFSVYNLGGLEMSNNELALSILRILGKDETCIEYVEDRKGHDLRYSVDDLRFREEFGEIKVSTFEKDLSDTINWYVSNQNWLNNSLERLKK
jgi:dTDP-glucose 4,6-dehydratase